MDSTLGPVSLVLTHSIRRGSRLTFLSRSSYIPIKIDYTDLFDVMAFFSGDLDGQNHHEHLAKQIADNGKDYTERFWRYEDMEACELTDKVSELLTHE